MPDRRALPLLERLHEAPGNPTAWLRFLDALRDAISPDAVALFAANPHDDRPGILAGSGIGVRLVPLGDFLRPSVTHPSASVLPAGAVRELSGAMLGESLLYREALAPAGVRPGPGLVAVTERCERYVRAATILLPRTEAWRPSAADRALLERLAPHMVLARRLHLRIAERRCETEALLAAFDHLALGVVLLGADGRVSYVNRSAAELLGLAPGFDDPHSAAAPADARTSAWQRIVGAERDWSRDAFVLEHPSEGRQIQFVAAPFGRDDSGGPLARRFTRAIFIGDPKRRTGDLIGLLNEIYGLTPGETRLALLLISDCSVEEAANLLGISRSTARSVLKRIFEKTGTNRQSALVHLLLTGFAQVRAGSRPAGPASPRPLRHAGSSR
jgi:DNA-binding CsgD family transcriptional regulator/PAS domain-containing protein